MQKCIILENRTLKGVSSAAYIYDEEQVAYSAHNLVVFFDIHETLGATRT